ncbi:WAT1-related protein At1g43650 isoform X2 [Euphorbia lathyris]|uniref:WAT1-related protein At1g43650 isoform X2 n=1 Tax=Euphorbia lathyris TaxID=212925 RepID=UPI0033135296
MSCCIFKNGNNVYKPYLAIMFMQCAFSGMALLSKAAISKGMSPFVFVVYRQAFASLALAPFAFFLERKTAPPLSHKILCKIFFVSFSGLTLSLNLYYVAMNNITATFAAASTNIIPAITFLMAVLLRMESISFKHWHGIAKILGSAIGVSGALVFAFVKGAPLTWYDHHVQSSSSITCCSKRESIKGSNSEGISSKAATNSSTMLVLVHSISNWGSFYGEESISLETWMESSSSCCRLLWNNSEWNMLLVANMDNREERTSIYIKLHSFSSYYNSHFLCFLVERDPTLGKCWRGCFAGGWPLLCIMGEEQRRR